MAVNFSGHYFGIGISRVPLLKEDSWQFWIAGAGTHSTESHTSVPVGISCLSCWLMEGSNDWDCFCFSASMWKGNTAKNLVRRSVTQGETLHFLYIVYGMAQFGNLTFVILNAWSQLHFIKCQWTVSVSVRLRWRLNMQPIKHIQLKTDNAY